MMTGPVPETPTTIEVLDCSPPSTRDAVTSPGRVGAAYGAVTVCPVKAGSRVLLADAAWAKVRPWSNRQRAAT